MRRKNRGNNSPPSTLPLPENITNTLKKGKVERDVQGRRVKECFPVRLTLLSI